MDLRVFYPQGGFPILQPDLPDGTYSDIHLKAHDVLVGVGGLTMAGNINMQNNNLVNVANLQTTQLNGQAVTTGTLNGVAISSNGVALSDLSDVILSTPSTNQVLTYNGTKWVNANGSGGTVTNSAVRAQQTATQVIPATTTTTVLFPTSLYDYNNDYNASTGIFTVPVNGVYTFSCYLTINNPSATDCNFELTSTIGLIANVRINPNGISNSTTNTSVINLSGNIRLSAGNTVQLNATCSGATTIASSIFDASLVRSA